MEIKNNLLDIEDVKKSKLSLLDLFIRKTAVITSTQESLVEKIIKDQWSQANKKTSPSSNIAEIDFVNLGTFFVSKAKAKRRLDSLDKANVTLGAHEGMIEQEVIRRETQIDRNNRQIQSINLKTKKGEN